MKGRLIVAAMLMAGIAQSYALDLETEFTEKMVDAIAYTEGHQADVWPGFHLTTPMIGHFSRNVPFHAYAFNLQPTNPVWRRLNVHNQPVYLLDNDIYHIETLNWGADSIDNQETFIRVLNVTFPNNDADTQVADLIMFRFFYGQHYEDGPFGKEDAWKYPIYTWSNQVKLTKLFYQEIEALKAYVLSTNASDKQAALRDAIAINMTRGTYSNSLTSTYDQFVSLHWGLSSYVGWKSANVSDPNKYLSMLASECDISIPSSSEVSNINSCQYGYSYWFSSLAYGLALDDMAGVEWKTKLMQEKSSPHQLAVKIAALSKDEAALRMKDIDENNRYNGKQIDDMLKENYIPYMQQVEKLESGYKQSKGIEVEVYAQMYDEFFAKRKEHSALFPEFKTGIHYLVNNLVAITKNYTFDRDIDYKGHQYALHVKYLPFLYHDVGGYIDFGPQWQKYKVAPDTKLVINGKEETVAHFLMSPRNEEFTSFTLVNKQIKLSMSNLRHGEINNKDGKVNVKFVFME